MSFCWKIHRQINKKLYFYIQINIHIAVVKRYINSKGRNIGKKKYEGTMQNIIINVGPKIFKSQFL